MNVGRPGMIESVDKLPVLAVLPLEVLGVKAGELLTKLGLGSADTESTVVCTDECEGTNAEACDTKGLAMSGTGTVGTNDTAEEVPVKVDTPEVTRLAVRELRKGGGPELDKGVGEP